MYGVSHSLWESGQIQSSRKYFSHATENIRPKLTTYFLVYFLILHRKIDSRLQQFTVHWHPSLCLTDLG